MDLGSGRRIALYKVAGAPGGHVERKERGRHERTSMGTLPIKCGGDLVRLALQKGSVRRNRTQADDPGAPRDRWGEPDNKSSFPALLALNNLQSERNVAPSAETCARLQQCSVIGKAAGRCSERHSWYCIF